MTDKVPIILIAYRALKEALRDGVYLPGDRLDAATIGKDLQISHIPVREALGRLLGENLVESHINLGYFVPMISEKGLRDLYEWHLHQILLAIDIILNSRRPWHPNPQLAEMLASDSTRLTEALFLDIALTANNNDISRSIANVNDRLHWIRSQKDQLIEDQPLEITSLAQSWLEGDLVTLREGLITYHVRRQAMAEDLLALIHEHTAKRRLSPGL